ncbi:hypothetical protein QBC38DRAFT_539224 [Podospora fimiseda]|uniref:NAD(P)-binding domain-containing protein n=1 Tax=Podospora fimiseda TaxID=252190 RepID=A0AAN7BGW5_9PEZI|nr:hypothetical protein QBC38DRAFT_539224 [Podospora fimiseda]
MKLLLYGSTGFLATKIIRQALSNPSITSLIAIGRRPLPTPDFPDIDTTKLESFVVDFDSPTPYDSDPVLQQHIKTADACIWTIAITPAHMNSVPWEQVERVCHDYTVEFVRYLVGVNEKLLGGKDKFRFVYVSGHNAARPKEKKPFILGEYCMLRGKTESEVLELLKGGEVCVARPGIIEGGGKETGLFKGMFFWMIGLPNVRVEEVAGAVLEGVMKGFGEVEGKGKEKRGKDGDGGWLWRNEDLVRIGEGVVGKRMREKTTSVMV